MKIPVVRTGWADKESNLDEFDIIIGSDLLYEREHTDLVSKFINQHAKRVCDVIIVDSGRGNLASFTRKMEGLGVSSKKENIFKTPALADLKNLIALPSCIIHVENPKTYG